jgi:CheY-like chemotaxis protein
MAVIASRQGLVDYCLRRLGEPVVEVNVDEDQLEDKIDDAIQLYQEFHSDATTRTYYEHQLTQTDLDNKYITIPNSILYVTKMMPISTGLINSTNMFSFNYQLAMSDMGMQGMAGAGGLAHYEQMQQYLALIDMKINGLPLVQFSRRQNRLYLWSDIEDGQIVAGDHVAIECYETVDPSLYTSVYNDMFIKDYTTALIKEQWGQNMSKFEGMQLPGGVTINGSRYIEEGREEQERLRERMRLEQEVPPDFFVG